MSLLSNPYAPLLADSNLGVLMLSALRLWHILWTPLQYRRTASPKRAEILELHTIVFVTGRGLTFHHARPVQGLFEQAGYRFRHVQLSAARNTSPSATIRGEDVELISNAINAEMQASQDVILVLHSSAAGPGLSTLSEQHTLKSFPCGAVVRIILIAANMDDFEADLPLPQYGHACADDIGVDQANAATILFSDLPPYDAQHFADALDTTDEDDGINADHHEPTRWWQAIPCTYIACMRDQAISPEYQTSLPSRYGMALVELESDHCPMVSHPEGLVEAVQRIAEQAL